MKMERSNCIRMVGGVENAFALLLFKETNHGNKITKNLSEMLQHLKYICIYTTPTHSLLLLYHTSIKSLKNMFIDYI